MFQNEITGRKIDKVELDEVNCAVKLFLSNGLVVKILTESDLRIVDNGVLNYYDMTGQQID